MPVYGYVELEVEAESEADNMKSLINTTYHQQAKARQAARIRRIEQRIAELETMLARRLAGETVKMKPDTIRGKIRYQQEQLAEARGIQSGAIVPFYDGRFVHWKKNG